jgi:hypothetical protein
LQCEVVSLQQLEVVDTQLHDTPNLEIAVNQISPLRFIIVPLSL